MNKASFEDEFQMPLPVTFSCSKYLALVFLLLISFSYSFACPYSSYSSSYSYPLFPSVFHLQGPGRFLTPPFLILAIVPAAPPLWNELPPV